MNQSVIEAIVKHPAVSSVYSNGCKIELCTKNPSIQALCRLHRMRRNAKRGIQNAREDVQVAGYTDSLARMPQPDQQRQLIEKAYAAQGKMPATLIALLEKALGIEGQTAKGTKEIHKEAK